MPTLRLFNGSVTAPVFLCALLTPALHADLTSINFFTNAFWDQTSASAPTGPPSGFFFDLGATEQNAGDFSDVAVTYPGPGSPQDLTYNPTSLSFGFGSPGISPASAYLAAYPFGSYTFNATGGSAGPQTETLSRTPGNYFASAIPALSAATYNGLQGYQPNLGLAIAFDSFIPGIDATSGGSPFFTIWNAGTGNIAFSAALPYGDTSVNLPGGTLQPGTAYNWELDFSDRIYGQTNDGVFTTEGFDLRTDGTFMTGSNTPEPGFIVPLVFGLGAVLGAAILRRRDSNAACRL